MSYRVDNAVIMAAGTASRFAPLSFERPKALIEVKGEVLIERQIRQLKEAGIDEIYLVVGYKKEAFYYLEEKFGVKILENPEYLTRNNNGSLFVAKDVIRNSYICSSDNYFSQNPFENEVDDAYYAAVFAHGDTKEWCMTEGEDGYINSVTVGGENAWFMLGHTFWTEEFSKTFFEILDPIYHEERTRSQLWESIFMEHLDRLKMKIRRYEDDVIFEFDTLDELREFDESYRQNTRSAILAKVAGELGVTEERIVEVLSYKDENEAAAGFRFRVEDALYQYDYKSASFRRVL